MTKVHPVSITTRLSRLARWASPHLRVPPIDSPTTSIGQVRCAEDVFGVLSGSLEDQLRAARIIFHRLSKVIHPDRYPQSADKQLAHRTMTQLNSFWTEARDKINLGYYAVDPAATLATIRVSTRKHDYDIGAWLGTDEICQRYACRFMANGAIQQGVFKIARVPDDNDLMTTEAQVLRHLRGDMNFKRLFPFVPKLHASFLYDAGTTAPRQANVVSQVPDVYSLEDIRTHYPRGLDVAQIADRAGLRAGEGHHPWRGAAAAHLHSTG